MYILTSPFTKTFDTLGLLYFVPDFLVSQIKEGIIVECPIWTKIENSIVLEIVENIEEFCELNKIRVSEDKIRSISWIVTETQFISKENIKIAQFVSNYYFTQIHNSINLFFPNIIRKKIFWLDGKFFGRIEKVEEKVGYKSICTLQDIKLNTFSEKQEKAYLEIKENFKNSAIIPFSSKGDEHNLSTEGFSPLCLLYWITGSWKTEIYIKLILDNLKQNKQSLLLIPEIILNNQIWEKIIKIFWEENVIIINSSITDWKKAEYFADIYTWKAKIILWTRSSLFYPYKNLWLIIMDEEHDNSYNSDKSPRYKTKEILQKMLEINPALNILLASWTPSINSMYKAVKGEWNLVNLLEKFNN